MFPRVLWACTEQCGRLSRGCSDCIRQLQRQDRIDEAVVVVGTGAQLFEAKSESKGRTMSQLQRFVKNSGIKFIFSSMPSRDSSSNPTSYRRPNSGAQSIYWKSLDLMRQHSVPFVDTFQMTHSCYQEGCKVDDEAHGSRFVNRWKAQLLLNVLCDFQGDVDKSIDTPPNESESNIGMGYGAATIPVEHVEDSYEGAALVESEVTVRHEKIEEEMLTPLASEESETQEDNEKHTSVDTSREPSTSVVMSRDESTSLLRTGRSSSANGRSPALGTLVVADSGASKLSEDHLKVEHILSSQPKGKPDEVEVASSVPKGVDGNEHQHSRLETKGNKADDPDVRQPSREAGVAGAEQLPGPWDRPKKLRDVAVSLDRPGQKSQAMETGLDKNWKGKIRFVNFPHRDLGKGQASACKWVGRNADDSNDSIVSQLLGGDLHSPDRMQKRVLEESICVPDSEKSLSQLHLFSTVEARACLSNISLAIAGDSYNRQLFIGLGEILLANATNEHITSGAQRNVLLREMGEVGVEMMEL